jgi:hypothetical protein
MNSKSTASLDTPFGALRSPARNPRYSPCFVFSSLLVLAAATGAASGATINYGNFIAGDVQFLDVTESSGTDAVPLFGPPSSYDGGLNFTRVGFRTTSVGGVPDLTDGQLNVTIRTAPDVGIASISLWERGDYTLAGVGTAATQAGAVMLASVTGIGGAGVAPVALPPINASVAFNLPANPGIVQPWSLGLSLNVAPLLGPDQLATEIELVIDNALVSFSELQSVAFGAKKQFFLEVDTVTTGIPLRTAAVPEAGFTIWLLGLGLGLVFAARPRVARARR